jgi:hypothetical protein
METRGTDLLASTSTARFQFPLYLACLCCGDEISRSVKRFGFQRPSIAWNMGEVDSEIPQREAFGR